ncbi:hypothetical protein MycrhN_2552 [Mycolicibacterium rhodesiae NBB3]|uniref:Uncharacterized protein n=1 Tax=Mycolicibacterium rhodesiae (strain NBB3) TaxID=710685 RepID=G8RX89_MYCRN|nr:hypothetical protein [Mycolicibacterium rhodesiae]AEV73137.1 hypothetical protein MycrhN_2552 [Mycolicibacterium rhodesiae NBB3]
MNDRVELWPGSRYAVTPAGRAVVRADAEQHVAAVRETARAASMTWPGFGSGRDCGHLFDPTLMPHMARRADEVMHRLQTSPDLAHIDHCPPDALPYSPDDPHRQSLLFVHFVSAPDVLHVFRDAESMQCWLWAQWPTGHCNIRVCDVPPCPVTDLGTFIPVVRGQFQIWFEACPTCRRALHRTFDANYAAAVEAAWANPPIPRWARNA